MVPDASLLSAQHIRIYDVIKMVPDASLLSAQHIRIYLACLSSQTSLKNKMDFIWNERSIVINKSWDNLLRNRPKINKIKSLEEVNGTV